MKNTGASAKPTGLSQQAATPLRVDGPPGFDPSRWRAALRAAFNDGALRIIVKGANRGGYPIGADGKIMSWSDWLADKVESYLASAGEASGRDGETRLDAEHEHATAEGGDAQNQAGTPK